MKYLTEIVLNRIFKVLNSTCFQIDFDSNGADLHSNYPENSIDLQKTAYLALCLQHPAKMLGFSLLHKLMLCWAFYVFGRRQKQGNFMIVSEGGANIGLWANLEGICALCDIIKELFPELCHLAHFLKTNNIH